MRNEFSWLPWISCILTLQKSIYIFVKNFQTQIIPVFRTIWDLNYLHMVISRSEKFLHKLYNESRFGSAAPEKICNISSTINNLWQFCPAVGKPKTTLRYQRSRSFPTVFQWSKKKLECRNFIFVLWRFYGNNFASNMVSFKWTGRVNGIIERLWHSTPTWNYFLLLGSSPTRPNIPIPLYSCVPWRSLPHCKFPRSHNNFIESVYLFMVFQRTWKFELIGYVSGTKGR